MKASTYEVTKRSKSINVFRVGRLWVLKYYFGDKEIFKALVDFYNKRKYRFEFKTVDDLERASVLLQEFGFQVQVVEDLDGYLVKLKRFSKYAPVLKNSVESLVVLDERIFLMKDLAAVEDALAFGAKAYSGKSPF
ncbi:MAG: hypothetical protein GKC10_05405 [Methanosarcinales archaeon]|nr:hypothetical protein [Methanosarcinales archaeon]